MPGRTVLQQGDIVGTQGEKGEIGLTGETGAAGQPHNILSIEGIFTFQAGTPYYTFAKNYFIKAGETDFWVANASQVWTPDGTKAIITLTNILQDDTKKFGALIQVTKSSYANDTLPTTVQGIVFDVAVANLSSAGNGTIELRIVSKNSQASPPPAWSTLGQLYPGGKFQFTLTIFGEAS